MQTGITGNLLLTPPAFERIYEQVPDYFDFIQFRDYHLYINSYREHPELDEVFQILAREKDLPGPDTLMVYADHPLFNDRVLIYPGYFRKLPDVSEGLLNLIPLLVPETWEAAKRLRQLNILTTESLVLVVRKIALEHSPKQAVKLFLRELLDNQFNVF